MKKYGKILSVLLCLAMLVCTIAMVATADETSQQTAGSNKTGLGALKRGTSYEMVSPKRLTSVFGYYRDNTGADEQTFVDCGKGAGLTDGWYGNPGSAGCTTRNGLVAAIITVDSTINLGGIEIVANDRNGEGDGDLKAFVVQAWVNGEWVDLVTERDYLFNATRGVSYTFSAVQTNKVRIIVNAHWDREAKMKEVTLFEKKSGYVSKTLNLNGKIGECDCDMGEDANILVDGNKANYLKFTDAVIDVDTSGDGVAIDGFVLYPYSGDKMYPKEVSIYVLSVGGKQFDLVGTYKTGWVKNTSIDPLKIVFDKTYMAIAVVINIDMGVVSDFELFQYQRDPYTGNEPEEPPRNPTQPTTAPTEPTAAPTEPTAAPTEPTTAPTEPTQAPTEPTVAPTEPTIAPTEPEETEPEVTEPEVTEPEETEPEATEPEVTEPEATEPADPTESSAPTTDPTEAPVSTEDSGKTGTIILYILIGLAVVAVAAAAVVCVKDKKA